MRVRSILAVLVLPVLLAACGGGDGGSAATTSVGTTTVTKTKRTTTVSTTDTGTRPAKKRKKPAASKGLVVALTGQSHQVRAGTPWRYVVQARTDAGKPVGGTAILQVIVGDRVVDTIGWFTFDGTLRRTYRFSPQIRGRSGVVLSAKIIASGKSKRATYAVRVV